MNQEALEDLPNLQSAEETIACFDKDRTFHIEGQMWCPICKLKNRFTVKPVHLTANQDFFSALKNRSRTLTNSGVSGPSWRPLKDKSETIMNSQFHYACTRCQGTATGLFLVKNERTVASIFFKGDGSIATKNTPATVRYFLEQAYTCQSVKAFSATLAMYRTALDAILYNAGYKEGMVGKKIANMESDVSKGNGPMWARNLATQYLKVIKDLGNSSLHISSDELKEEQAIDDDLIQEVELTFHTLLDEAYEKDLREKTRLEKLTAVSQKKAGKSNSK